MRKILLILLSIPLIACGQTSPTNVGAYGHPLPDFTPNAPTSLTATAGIGTIALSWTAPVDIYGVTDTDISLYTVQRKTGVGGTWATLTTRTTTSYTDASGVAGTTYYYRVSATDVALHVSSYSNEANASPTADTTAPTVPGSFVATANGTTITITWTASTDVGGSGVENYSGDRSLAPDFSSPTSFTTTALSFAHANLTASTTYYYRVRAKDFSGNYSTYATAQATTATPSAGPNVTSVSGTITNGQLITVSGSGFGSRAPTQQLFDNLETGGFLPQWTRPDGYPPGRLYIESGSTATLNRRHQFSTVHSAANFVGSGSGGWAHPDGGSNSTQWFCQYWFKLDPDWTWGVSSATQGTLGTNLANVKIMRLWSTGSSPEDFAIAAHGWRNEVIVIGENISGESTYVESGYLTNWSKGVWHCMQLEFRENSAVGVADGYVRWWFDGRLAFSDDSRVTRLNNSETKRPFGIGFYNSNGDPSTDSNHVYFDEYFYQNTFARVEIGNNPTYSQCTLRELQPTYVSWSDGQIQLQLNQGSFTTGQQAYVFVVNSNGANGTNVSTGFPITIQ